MNRASVLQAAGWILGWNAFVLVLLPLRFDAIDDAWNDWERAEILLVSFLAPTRIGQWFFAIRAESSTISSYVSQMDLIIFMFGKQRAIENYISRDIWEDSCSFSSTAITFVILCFNFKIIPDEPVVPVLKLCVRVSFFSFLFYNYWNKIIKFALFSNTEYHCS